ncbi:MAG: methionine--tRNA ligase subunit beta, partial [Oscillospiraceae bacterium]|nr:methionine--tRNA ligase subunit beta [Oscillospiraceae bacterium]
IAAVMLLPFMPNTAPKIFAQIGIGSGGEYIAWESARIFGKLPANVTVQKGETLFPRIDLEKELAELEALNAAKTEKPPEKPQGITSFIDIADFARVELKVAQVTGCEPVPKSDKLLLLKLDDGSGDARQVVSGISQWYKPDALTGRKIVLVANLKPAKLRGVESQGMILAADAGENDVRVIFADDGIPAGSKVR